MADATLKNKNKNRVPLLKDKISIVVESILAEIKKKKTKNLYNFG